MLLMTTLFVMQVTIEIRWYFCCKNISVSTNGIAEIQFGDFSIKRSSSEKLLDVKIEAKLNPSRPDPGQREKIDWNVLFNFFCSASKDFAKTLKTFIKPFEAPQKSVKIKI